MQVVRPIGGSGGLTQPPACHRCRSDPGMLTLQWPWGVPARTPYGQWVSTFAGCVDITDLNPPPSPDEVYRYFRTLPLPQLTTRQQPPGNALVNLPVIFFTD